MKQTFLILLFFLGFTLTTFSQYTVEAEVKPQAAMGMLWQNKDRMDISYAVYQALKGVKEMADGNVRSGTTSEINWYCQKGQYPLVKIFVKNMEEVTITMGLLGNYNMVNRVYFYRQ